MPADDETDFPLAAREFFWPPGLGAIPPFSNSLFFNRPQPEALLPCGVRGGPAAWEGEIPPHPPTAEEIFRMGTVYENPR
jgi:hypothetical protein